jgi:hypothetical protein
MFDLMRDRAGREIADDRLRTAQRERLGPDARLARNAAHRTQVERVRASLLLNPRTAEEATDA